MSKITAINTAATSERELTEAELEHNLGRKRHAKITRCDCSTRGSQILIN